MANNTAALPNKEQLQNIRLGMRSAYLADEQVCIESLLTGLDLATETREAMSAQAA